jgi:hypothetical protein
MYIISICSYFIQQEEENQNNLKTGKPVNATRMQGFKDFQKARLTTEEIYNNIFNGILISYIKCT